MCSKCGRPLVSEKGVCCSCASTPWMSAMDRIIPLFPYDGGGQRLLTSWKIDGCRGLSAIFASVIDKNLSTIPDIKLHATIVPVPPRPGKIRSKGWDQIEELSRILENKHHVKIERILQRTAREQQKSLGREARLHNMKGNISCLNVKAPETAIIIDDLMTTGATLESCAEALKNAGSRVVYGLTLFHD